MLCIWVLNLKFKTIADISLEILEVILKKKKKKRDVSTVTTELKRVAH